MTVTSNCVWWRFLVFGGTIIINLCLVANNLADINLAVSSFWLNSVKLG